MKQSTRRSRPRSAPQPTYWDAAREPLYCLVFLTPLIAAYEFGAWMLRVAQWPEQQLVAVRVVRDLLAMFNVTGVFLPGVALLATLLIWHMLSRASWQLRVWALPLMLLESVVLTAPLLALGALALQAGGAQTLGLPEQMVIALGAGIYEELVFRLLLISLLLMLLSDLARAPDVIARSVAISLGALIFALCHYQPIGSDLFAWGTFCMRALAGAYLSILFVYRGLGICAAVHALYNLMIVLMR